MGTPKKHKATVVVDFKIHEEGKIVSYKKGKEYSSTNKTLVDNLKKLNKLK